MLNVCRKVQTMLKLTNSASLMTFTKNKMTICAVLLTCEWL